MSKTYKGKYSPRNPTSIEVTHKVLFIALPGRGLSVSGVICERTWFSGRPKRCIQYKDPVQKKTRRYFPDFIIKVRESDGLIVTKMIEIKPHKEVVGPERNPKRKTKSWLYAVQMYVNNQAKWEAAKKFCEKQGWQFVIITEYELGLKKRK